MSKLNVRTVLVIWLSCIEDWAELTRSSGAGSAQAVIPIIN